MRKIIKVLLWISVCFIAIGITPQKRISAAAVSTAKQSTVRFDANGGEEIADTISVTFGSEYGELPVAVRKNYKFEGWYTFAFGGIKITEQSKVSISRSHTLYAHWQGKEREISLDANGGTSKKDKVAVYYGSKFLNQLPVPVRENYKFEGWYTKSEGGVKISRRTIYDDDTGTKLYARWSKKSIKLIFIAFNNEKLYKKVYLGEAYGELPVPEKEGYEFGGWFTYDDYTDYNAKAVTQENIVTEGTQRKLYARWYFAV